MEKISDFYRWYDEPDFISVKINKSYSDDLIKRAIKKSKTIENLSKTIRISKATIHNYKNGTSMNIKGLKTILDFLDIKYDRINHRIEKIGWDNINLKINLKSNEMAIILAASLADGHLNQSHFMYKNKNLELINRIKDCVKKTFGDVKIIDKVDKNGTSYILCTSFVKRQLERLGSPKGKKLFHNPSIPEVIKKGTKMQKKLFIQQFFDDEGWPEVENRRVACSQSADTTSILPKKFISQLVLKEKYSVNKILSNLRSKIVKPNLLLDIQNLLKEDFGINTRLNLKRIARYKWGENKDYVSAVWELSCARKEGVKKFERDISFFSSNKRAILKEIIKEKLVPDDIFFRLLNIAIKLQREKHYFRVKDMQKYLDLERGRIRKRLTTLTRQKILYNEGGKYQLRLHI